MDWKNLKQEQDGFQGCTLWHCDHKYCPGEYNEKNKLCKE